jgi:ATP-dependent exoDNAse (exonuclease V) beta subunit
VLLMKRRKWSSACRKARCSACGIDLLLETNDAYVVIDHKTYGNPDEAAVWKHAEQYLPQMAAYGAAIAALGGKRVGEYWLHFGVGGVCARGALAQP